MKINKIKELKTVYKMLICIVITIISMICAKLIMNDWNSKIEKFDYSKIYSINGVITKVERNDIVFGYGTGIYYHIYVRLENEETIKMEFSGDTGYSEGESIIIYTDGIHYSTTQKGIAADEQLVFFNLLGSCAIMFLALVVWIWLFEWKGFLIGLFIFLVTLA